MEHEYKENCNCMGCMAKRHLTADVQAEKEKHPTDCRCISCMVERGKEQGNEQFESSAKELDKLRPVSRVLVSFESGNYKKLIGNWASNSTWTQPHWEKSNGKYIHINKDKVEYYEEL